MGVEWLIVVAYDYLTVTFRECLSKLLEHSLNLRFET